MTDDSSQKLTREAVAKLKAIVEQYRSSEINLESLVDELRSTFDATGVYKDPVRWDFEDVWSIICYEMELRTESWAPVGSSTDETLERAIQRFEEWLETLG